MKKQTILVVAVAAAAILVLSMAASAYLLLRAPSAMQGVVVTPGEASLTVSDQRSSAGTLVVDRILVPGPSWLVVSVPDSGGSGPEVVGRLHVVQGQTLHAAVPLDPGVGLFTKVTVTVHADRGIAGTFEFDPARYEASPDKPYFVGASELATTVVRDTIVTPLWEAAGARVSMEPSAAPGTAVLELASRLTAINGLHVDRVVAPAGSWVAVYLVNDDGSPGALAGAARVGSGESTDVDVPFQTESAISEKLLVVLHIDLGERSAFEFEPADFAASPDKPYAVDGVEVSREVLLRDYGMDSGNVTGSGSGM